MAQHSQIFARLFLTADRSSTNASRNSYVCMRVNQRMCRSLCNWCKMYKS